MLSALFFSRFPQNRLDVLYFWPSELKPACNVSRPSDICNRFWIFVASELSIVSKTFSNDSMVRTRCGGYRLCDWSSNLRRVAKDSNVILPFLSSSSFSSYFSSSSSFLSCFDRRCVIVVELSLYRVHGGEGERGLWTICRNGLIIGLKRLSFSILSVFRVRCLANRFAHLFNLLRDFFHARTHQPYSSLAKYR